MGDNMKPNTKPKTKHEEFKVLEEEYNQLWREGKIKQVLEKVEEAARQFPEEDYTISLDLTAANLELGNLEKAKGILQESLAKGYWFPQMFIEPIFENEDFKVIVKQWEELKEAAEKNSKPDYLVILPENYQTGREYPLFMAFHGWGEEASFFSWYWKSSRIREEFILVLPQSSQIIGSHHYCWTDRELALKEVGEIFEKVKSEYNIDLDRVVLGGFSQGGALSIDLNLNQDQITSRGFIALCPIKPEVFTAEKIKKAAEQGKKGMIITGNQDPSYQEQQEMAKEFNKQGFEHELLVEEGLAHWFPKKLDEYLDQAIKFIVE